jgi:hypothetical protein
MAAERCSAFARQPNHSGNTATAAAGRGRCGRVADAPLRTGSRRSANPALDTPPDPPPPKHSRPLSTSARPALDGATFRSAADPRRPRAVPGPAELPPGPRRRRGARAGAPLAPRARPRRRLRRRGHPGLAGPLRPAARRLKGRSTPPFGLHAPFGGLPGQRHMVVAPRRSASQEARPWRPEPARGRGSKEAAPAAARSSVAIHSLESGVGPPRRRRVLGGRAAQCPWRPLRF